jgi:hypothetical protein
MDIREISQGEMLNGTPLTIDVNSVAVNNIFTVPALKSNGSAVSGVIITGVSVFEASISLTTASFGFGFDASGIDWAASALHTALNGPTKFIYIPAPDGAILGTASGVFKCGVTIAQGAAATIKVFPFGIIY